MADLSIPDLPDDAYDELAARAERAGLAVEAYIRRELVALAERPDVDRTLERIRKRREGLDDGPTTEDILAAKDADRP